MNYNSLLNMHSLYLSIYPLSSALWRFELSESMFTKLPFNKYIRLNQGIAFEKKYRKSFILAINQLSRV